MTDKATTGNEPQFGIQKIYIKDSSFESPRAPDVFNEEWEPDVKLDLNVSTNKLVEDHYEVVLKIIVTVNSKDKVAFLVEVNQAGIFLVKGFPEDQLKPMLGSFCPNVLYPYAREAVSEIINKGGFPPLYLAPINFDALYQQQQEQGQGGEEESKIIH